MLGQAVRAYRTQRAEAVPPITQQRFASHSANPPPDSRTREDERMLRPSALSTINGAVPCSVAPDGALKRKTREFNNGVSSSQRGRMNDHMGVLSKLHDEVFFDESDFVDDADINLDEDSPFPTRHATALDVTAAMTATPKQPSSGSVHYPILTTSQISWSSSPADHLQSAKAQTGHRFQQSEAQTPTSIRESVQNEGGRPAKRRQLPWQSTVSRPTAIVANGRAESTAAQQTSEAAQYLGSHHDRKDRLSTHPHLALATPVSKTSSNNTLPWNKTASAVKEDQRKLRQQSIQLKNPMKEETAEIQAGVKASFKALITSSQIEKPTEIELSSEQKKVLQLISYGKKSVFFTGSAGTGKSVLMREIIQVLKRNYTRDADRVAVTASTGLAACNIGGVTLHSFSGIGLGKEPVENLVRKIKRNPKARQRWLRTKVLIIDEISMVDGEMFDKLEEIARILRNNGRPFGGIQLVITGDFFQLPPVPDRGKPAKFTFEAATWSTSIQHTIGLTHVFRQKDPEFASMLNDMRLGKLTPQAIEQFRSLKREIPIKDEIEPTELFPTRQEVDRANENRMRALSGNAIDFLSLDGGSMQDISKRTELLQNCMAPEKLSLKINAQVMLIKNIDDTLVNGSIGKVARFMDEQTYDFACEKGDDPTADTSELIGEDASKAQLGAIKFRSTVGASVQKYPLVQFQLADGSVREMLCVRETWKVEQPNGEVIASRMQVPLIPAWALSIHKAQGQTLDRVRVDLGKVFERGQAYVALSRATTQNGLQVLRFDPKKVMAHEKVRKFYNSLANLSEPKVEIASMHDSRQTRQVAHLQGRDDSLFLDNDDDAFADGAF